MPQTLSLPSRPAPSPQPLHFGDGSTTRPTVRPRPHVSSAPSPSQSPLHPSGNLAQPHPHCPTQGGCSLPSLGAPTPEPSGNGDGWAYGPSLLSSQDCWAPQPLPSPQPYRPSSRRSWGKGHLDIRRIAWWGAPGSQSGYGAPKRGIVEGLSKRRESVK